MATKTLTKPKTVVFMAQGENFHLERVPPEEQITHGRARALTGTGKMFTFDRAGATHVRLELKPGEDVRPDAPDGSEQDAIAWIRGHELYGDRIWEVEPEAPDPSETLTEIAQLAARRDEDAIASLLSVEQSEDGWQRQIVIDSALTTLRALEGLSEPQEGSQGHPDSEAAQTEGPPPAA